MTNILKWWVVSIQLWFHELQVKINKLWSKLSKDKSDE